MPINMAIPKEHRQQFYNLGVNVSQDLNQSLQGIPEGPLPQPLPSHETAQNIFDNPVVKEALKRKKAHEEIVASFRRPSHSGQMARTRAKPEPIR